MPVSSLPSLLYCRPTFAGPLPPSLPSRPAVFPFGLDDELTRPQVMWVGDVDAVAEAKARLGHGARPSPSPAAGAYTCAGDEAAAVSDWPVSHLADSLSAAGMGGATGGQDPARAAAGASFPELAASIRAMEGSSRLVSVCLQGGCTAACGRARLLHPLPLHPRPASLPAVVPGLGDVHLLPFYGPVRPSPNYAFTTLDCQRVLQKEHDRIQMWLVRRRVPPLSASPSIVNLPSAYCLPASPCLCGPAGSLALPAAPPQLPAC